MTNNRVDCYSWVPKAKKFEPRLLYIHPDDPRSTHHLASAAPDPAPRVGVIGGGIAGLTAAYELAARNCQVTLLEASSRFGGRIESYYFPDGCYGELGAMRIPSIHGCVWHYIDKLSLRERVRKFARSNDNTLLRLRNLLVRTSRWTDLSRGYPGLPARIWKRNPSDTFDSLIQQLWKWKTSWDLFDPDLTSQRARVTDQMTLWQSLCIAEAAGWIAGGSAPATISEETWSYLGHATANAGVERSTLLEAIVDSFPFSNSTMCRLDGGMDELVRGFVNELAGNGRCQLLSNSSVEALGISGNEVWIRWQANSEGGRPRQAVFDYAVCALPAPCVQRLRFGMRHGPSDVARAEAIAGITYGSAAKTLIHVRRRPWEKSDQGPPPQGAILGGGSLTDLPIQQVWYPSDSAEEYKPDRFAGTDDDGNDDPLPSAHHAEAEEEMPSVDPAEIPLIQRALTAGIDHPLRPTASWDQPGVLTGAYIWGSFARRLSVLSQHERSGIVLNALDEMHPEIRQEVDYPLVHRIWDSELSPGGGAYALFAPGEATRYQAALNEPIRDSNGTPRVYFAGEHLAIAHGWIQSAIQSALGCVMHLLDATSKPSSGPR